MHAPDHTAVPGTLRGRELTVWRGERCLFEALDFDLVSGQLALVTGPNGAGKTTLLRVLAGLAAPSAGTVTWNGASIDRLLPEQRASIAYRGHLDGLKKDLTVRENLRFHAALWGRAPDIGRLVTEVKLGAVVDTRTRHLSAGQRRRAALATLKLTAATLWILDEPMANLDRDGRSFVVEWIGQQLHAGGTVVVATHQPDELARPGTLMIELS